MKSVHCIAAIFSLIAFGCGDGPSDALEELGVFDPQAAQDEELENLEFGEFESELGSAASCVGSGCHNLDPQAAGCATISSSNQVQTLIECNMSTGNRVNVKLKFSPKCQAMWVRLQVPKGQHYTSSHRALLRLRRNIGDLNKQSDDRDVLVLGSKPIAQRKDRAVVGWTGMLPLSRAKQPVYVQVEGKYGGFPEQRCLTVFSR